MLDVCLKLANLYYHILVLCKLGYGVVSILNQHISVVLYVLYQLK